jgi:hypothetical protein
MKTIANAISKCAHESVGEIMQLMDVVEIKCVPQQDDVVSCGVHDVVLNCSMSILTHMADGPGAQQSQSRGGDPPLPPKIKS